MSTEVGVDRGRETLGRLRDVVQGIGRAVRENDLTALDRLVAEEESLLREIVTTHVTFGDDEAARNELRALVAEISRRNTMNAVLIQEQLALVKTMAHFLFKDRRAVDHLA